MKNVIKTKRLWLRPLEASDAEALSPAINEFEVSKWLAVVPFPYRLEDARSFIAGALNGKKIWAIIYEGRLVGVISIEKGTWLLACASCMGTGDHERSRRGGCFRIF